MKIHFQNLFPEPSLEVIQLMVFPGVGSTDLERGYGCVALKTPFHARLPEFARVPFQANKLKSQFTRPPFEKMFEILASTASIFAQILALKPPNLKMSVHKTPLSEAKIGLQGPHFGNPRRTLLPGKKKKLSAPQGFSLSLLTKNSQHPADSFFFFLFFFTV